jgi:hypothetical protein
VDAALLSVVKKNKSFSHCGDADEIQSASGIWTPVFLGYPRADSEPFGLARSFM